MTQPNHCPSNMYTKKESPYEPIILKALMIYASFSIIEDFMPEVKHLPNFSSKENKKWTENTLRYARLMLRRLELDVSRDKELPEAEIQMIHHLHNVQKTVALVSRLLPEDIEMVRVNIEEFMKKEYEPKAYQSVLS